MKYPLIPLGEICEFLYGEGLREDFRKGGVVPVYGSNGIVGWHNKALSKGETLIIGRKGSLGEVHLSKVPCWPIDTTYYVEKTKVPCDLSWLYYALRKLDLTKLNKAAAIPGLNRNDAYELKLTFPPVDEQIRTANLMGRADWLRRMRRYAHQLGETFLQSVFVEMFGDPERNPYEWGLVKLGNKMTFITSGSRVWAKYYADIGALFLRVQNIGANSLLLDDVAFVQPPKSAESKRTRVKSGDLLISATADIGRTGVIPENFPEAYINQHLFLIRLKEVNPIFVAGYFCTPNGKAQILRLNREGVKSGLNFNDVKGLVVFNPPLEKQEHFSEIVKQYHHLQSVQREAERQAEELFQALLDRSFKDKL